MERGGWRKQNSVMTEIPLIKILSDRVGKIDSGSITIIKQDNIIIQVNINEKIQLEGVIQGAK